MIPHKDLKQLIQYYKGELTENALFNKAATLAAKKRLVSQPPIAPGPGQCSNQTLESRINQVNQMHPSISGRGRCGGTGCTPGEEGEEEEGDLVTGPVEQWLKRMIKGSPSTPKPPITPATKKGKAAATTSKISIKKGSPSTSRGDDLRRRLEAIRERRKTLEKKVAESAWSKGKGKGKGPAREVERLKPLPGWEDWYRGKKLRRRLDYDSD